MRVQVQGTGAVKGEGDLWDMGRPLEGDCKLVFYKFEDDEGRDTFWHSSAHILGQVGEKEWVSSRLGKVCVDRWQLVTVGGKCVVLFWGHATYVESVVGNWYLGCCKGVAGHV